MIRSVVIDSREPPEVQRLRFYGAKKSIIEMEYGDIWATCEDGETLVIERKEPEDFINSMCSNRMIKQAYGLSKLREGGLWPYVMIMGEFIPGPNGRTYVNGSLRNINYAAIQGELLNIQELGVFVIHANDSRDLEEAVLRLSNRQRNADMTIPAAKRQGSTMSPPADFLTGLPGIGPGLAEAIIKNTRTAAHALELMTNRGQIPNVQIGAKRRAKIRTMLGLKETEELKVVKNERIINDNK